MRYFVLLVLLVSGCAPVRTVCRDGVCTDYYHGYCVDRRIGQ